ncbi:hypothetical protein [Ruegeria meonggei]|uniref:hypothetical protein n=1 Tax=Ruegeria meonggei TaxID=1446476 RepID=UPI00366C854B
MAGSSGPVWSTPSILWLSRDDDGSRHDGFAEYVCTELRDQGKPEGARVIIKVWSHQDMLRDQLTETGAHTCK